MPYCIKTGYEERLQATLVDQRKRKDEWQKDVYELSLDIAAHNQYKRILDIGCGSGYKLVQMFDKCEYYITGLEIEPNLSFIRKKYPDYDWRLSDFQTSFTEPVDLVICADVIEHLVDPDILLTYITKINFGHLVLSTPDRLQMYGYDHDGPPRNIHHVREWTQDEFNHYISSYFKVVSHKSTKRKGQVIVAAK